MFEEDLLGHMRLMMDEMKLQYDNLLKVNDRVTALCGIVSRLAEENSLVCKQLEDRGIIR